MCGSTAVLNVDTVHISLLYVVQAYAAILDFDILCSTNAAPELILRSGPH
jgi:hypothetical protein